ncbi:MAG: bacillithiol biosynthesis cysteine-adding enzyme BshC [Acidobacteriota bacterium]|nr:MAG: bacillithiol biosynthesis cysteine-adding enzyme BshC [Acidobacteriota bacterium]
MNDQPGTAADTRQFEISRLDLQRVPGQSALFLDFLHDHKKVSKFYPVLDRELSDVAEDVLANYVVDRFGLCAMLEFFNRGLGCGGQTLSNIERLRSESCVAVMTGQQAGLFSGPAYTVYKAISAIRLARELSESGIPAVPVFWIASEDHDLDEVSTTRIPDVVGGIADVVYKSGPEVEGLPVGDVRFGETIGRLVEEASERLASKHAGELLARSYDEGETFSSAFGKLLTQLLGEQGLIFVSPLNPGFRKLAAPLVTMAVESSAEIGEALRQRDSELQKSGYHSQVRIGDDFFPFFLIDDGRKRVPLRLAGREAVSRQDTNEQISLSELLEGFSKNPSILSPNAIMRPVVQDFVFPNVCYFGGSAEVAYFAQNSAVYGILERPSVPIRHRASFTILEPKNRRTMLSYSLGFEDVLKGRDEVTATVIEKYLDPETAEAFRNTRSEFESLIAELHSRLENSEPTLADSLAKRRKKILWHIDTLHKKFLKAESFKDDVAARRLAYLFSTVLPDGELQERTVNFLYFYAQFGERLIDWLIEAADAQGKEHTVLSF